MPEKFGLLVRVYFLSYSEMRLNEYDIDNKILSVENKLSRLHEQRREIINQMNKNKECKNAAK